MQRVGTHLPLVADLHRYCQYFVSHPPPADVRTIIVRNLRWALESTGAPWCPQNLVLEDDTSPEAIGRLARCLIRWVPRAPVLVMLVALLREGMAACAYQAQLIADELAAD